MAGPTLAEVTITGSYCGDELSVTITPDTHEGWHCVTQLPTQWCAKVVEPLTDHHIGTELVPSGASDGPGISTIVIKFGRKPLADILQRLASMLDFISFDQPRLRYRLTAGDNAHELAMTYHYATRRLEVAKHTGGPWHMETLNAFVCKVNDDPMLVGFCGLAGTMGGNLIVQLHHVAFTPLQLVTGRISELAAQLLQPH